MIDPTNLHPVDPEWTAKVDAFAKRAAEELGCMVLVMAVQDSDSGKCCLSVDGVPKSGPLAEIGKDPTNMIVTMAKAAVLQDLLHQAGRKGKDN